MVYTLDNLIADGKSHGYTPDQLDVINKQRIQKRGVGVPGWDQFYSAYKAQEPQTNESDTSNVLPAVVGIPAAGVAGAIGYGMLKPPSARRVNNLRSYVANMLTNKGANIAPEALDEKVDSLAKLIQNATKEDINKIKKAGFRGLYDFIKEKKDQVLGKRNEVIQQNKGVMISKESALAPLQEEISKAASVGDNSKVKSLQSIYNDVSGVFEKNGGQLPIEEAEKIKEAYYAKHKGRDKLESAGVSRADLETDVGYKKVGQGLKTAMEDATMSKGVAGKSPLTVWNQAYGTLADLEKTVAKTTTKAAKARTPSGLAVVFKGFNDTLKQIPGVRVATPKGPNIAPIAQEEAKLGGVLSDIRRWGNRVIKTSTAIDDDVAKAVNTVANTPGVKQVLGAGKKILKVAGPAMEAFGGFNPAQSIQDALNKGGAIVPSSGKLTPMKQA